MGKSPPNADGAADPSALVIDSVANNNAAPIEANIVTQSQSALTQSQIEDSHDGDHDEAHNEINNSDDGPPSSLPIFQPRHIPVCDKIIILYGAIMAHEGDTTLPPAKLSELINEIKDPNSTLNSVKATAHEIMSQNWNIDLSVFPSVIGAPDGNKFLIIIKEALKSLADMDIDDAQALLEEVYQAYPYFTPTEFRRQPVPLPPVDAFNMHWHSHIFTPGRVREAIIDYNNIRNFSGQFGAVYPIEHYLHQLIMKAEHPAISLMLEQSVHHQTAMSYLYLDMMHSGKSAPGMYAIDAVNQLSIDKNVLKLTLTKLSSSKFSEIAPAINTPTPQLIPDVNPELIYPSTNSRGNSRSLIAFIDEIKQHHTDVYAAIRRFQNYLHLHCYRHSNKTQYNPDYHKPGDESMGEFYFRQYKIVSYHLYTHKGLAGAGDDPEDSDPYESDSDEGEDDDDFNENEYKELDGLRDFSDAERKRLSHEVLGYCFALEDITKVLDWIAKYAAFLKAQAYQAGTAVRNLFREHGELAEYYKLNRTKNKKVNKVSCCFITVFHYCICLILPSLDQNAPPFNFFVALDAKRHASAKFAEVLSTHQTLVTKRDALRSDAQKAADIVKTAKETRDLLANAQPAKQTAVKSKTKAVSNSIVEKKRKKDSGATMDNTSRKKSARIDGQTKAVADTSKINAKSKGKDRSSKTHDVEQSDVSKSHSGNAEMESNDTNLFNNDAPAAKMPDNPSEANEPTVSTKAGSKRNPMNTKPATMDPAVAKKEREEARAKLKQSGKVQKKSSSAGPSKKSAVNKTSGMISTDYEAARGKGARDFITDEAAAQLKAKAKHITVGKEGKCKRGVASFDVVADKTSALYDHEVMKRRNTKPISTFPRLQNNEPSKYNYVYQSVSYLDESIGYQAFYQVVNKSGADSLASKMKMYSKFGSKQNTDLLNTSERKANAWTGLGDTPYHCNEYPSAAFQCPTLAHFLCGPKTSNSLVRPFCLCNTVVFVQ